MKLSMKHLEKLLNAWVPVVAWAAIIYVLSAQSALPSFEQSLLDFLFKKSSHMFVYAVLYFLTYRAVNIDRHELKHKNWWLPFLICLLYASSDEIHQIFTPHRTPNIRDIGYDALGMSIAFLRIYRYI